MAGKLLIVNNGLKDLRGHYFETAVSIAEAAERLGLRPVLGAHVDCPPSIIPDWLEFFPVFTTDHWMNGPPGNTPDLRGLRTELGPLYQTGINSVLSGKAPL